MADRRVMVTPMRAVLTLVLVSLVAWSALRGCGPVEQPLIEAPPRTDAPAPQQAAADAPLFERITLDGREFELELALTPNQRYQGLSDREYIPDDGGMLFVFPDEARRTFVMRRCLVPIDLIYLDAEGRVLNTHQMEVEPYNRPDWLLTRYRSDGPAQYVIELAGGMLDELALSPGDRIDLPADLKRRAR